MTVATKGSVVVSRGGNGATMKAAEAPATMASGAARVKAQVEAQLKAALDEAMSSPPPAPEVVDPEGWWDIMGYGPIQPGAGPVPFVDSPLLSHQVIRTGEEAYVVAILVLNPFGPLVPSASAVLSNFALPYQIEYSINNVRTFTHSGIVTHDGSLNPGQSFYVDVLDLDTSTAGLFELNISARILGCNGNVAPPFAGFARAIYDIDPDLFHPAPGLQFDHPIRYQIYV